MEHGKEAASFAGLDVQSVSYAFGPTLALDQVTLSILPSRFCVLLGLNGAGKTTLFSLITRLRGCDGGSIRVFGHDLATSPRQALGCLGVVFQDRTLDLDLSVLQNLRYHGALHGMSRDRAHVRAMDELERLGIAGLANDKVRRLSGGQMRRVEIARALLHEPALLLLDEPTVGLDVEARRSILDHMIRLCRDHGVAVLWATHLIDEVKSDSAVVVLDRGAVVASGPADQVIRATGGADMHEAFKLLTRGAA